ncbi:response regulator [Rhodovibrionaceae bacterium A322]
MAGADDLLLTRSRVLLVDDSPQEGKLMARLLRKIGVGAVRTVFDPTMAFSELHLFEADIAMIDLDMTPLDGPEVIQLIRTAAEVRYQDMPLICISGHALAQDVMKAKEAGADDYLVKPFSSAKIRQRLLMHLRGDLTSQLPGGAMALAPSKSAPSLFMH